MNILLVIACLIGSDYQPQTTPTKTDSVEMILSNLKGFRKLDTMRWLMKQYRFSDTRKAIRIGNEIISIVRREEIEYNPARTFMELGIDHTILTEHEKADRYYDSATFAAKDDEVILGNIYNNRAILSTFRERFDEALNYHLKSLEISERTSNNDGIMRSYSGIAWVYRSTKDFRTSLEYEQKSYDLAVNLKDEPSQYTVLGNMVTSLHSMHRDEEARDVNKKVINYFEKTSPNTIVVGNNYFNMATIYTALAKWDSSYMYGQKALAIFKNKEATRELAYTYPTLSRAAMALNRINEAEEGALKGYDLNKSLKRYEELEYNAFMLVKIYAYKRDLAKMDMYERELEAASDTLRKHGQAKAVAEIQTQYETTKKQHENDILKHESELKDIRLSQSRYIGFSSLLGIGLLTLVAITLYQKNQQRKRFNKVLQTENEKLKVEMLVAQLNQLKDQINPHFLFNSLATLQSMAQENDPGTGVFVQKLSEVYRYILQTNSDNLISLKEELKVAEAYMFMLKARFEDAFVASIDINEDILLKKIPPFSLQLLIENAIKHNSATHANPLKIKITIEDEHIVVRNNLQPKRSVADSTKIGLVNLQKRYFLMGEKNISIERSANEFIVRLPIYQ